MTTKLLEKLVNEVAEKEHFKNHTFTVDSGTEKGDNFLGQIFMVQIKEQGGRKLDLVIKIALDNENVRNKHPIKESFETEIYLYNTVIPALLKFQSRHNVREPLTNFVKCYGAHQSGSLESLIMENLRVQGFQCYNKRDMLDDEHNRHIFKKYAQLHALSFALKDQQPQEFQKLIKGYKTNVFAKIFDNKSVEEGTNYLLKRAIDKVPPHEEDIRAKLGKYRDDGAKLFIKLLRDEDSNSVILHGDCWSNNMMFKYEGSGDKKTIKDFRFIDWQLSKAGSPVMDLLYFFYSGGCKATFDKLDDYLRLYHENLKNFIEELGTDPDKIFPYETLQQHWKKYALFGFVMSLFLHKIKVTAKEDVVDLTDDIHNEEENGFVRAACDYVEYDKRIRDLVLHFHEQDLF